MGGTAGARMTDFFVNMPQQTQACHEAPWMDPSTQQPSWLPGMEQVPTADYVRTLTTWHEECALFSLLNPSQPARIPNMSQPPPYRRSQIHGSSASPMRPICNSWNRAKCAFAPVCSYRHVCASCQEGQHQAKDCALTPVDSIFRRPPVPRSNAKEGRL